MTTPPTGYAPSLPLVKSYNDVKVQPITGGRHFEYRAETKCAVGVGCAIQIARAIRDEATQRAGPRIAVKTGKRLEVQLSLESIKEKTVPPLPEPPIEVAP